DGASGREALPRPAAARERGALRQGADPLTPRTGSARSGHDALPWPARLQGAFRASRPRNGAPISAAKMQRLKVPAMTAIVPRPASAMPQPPPTRLVPYQTSASPTTMRRMRPGQLAMKRAKPIDLVSYFFAAPAAALPASTTLRS